MEKGTIRSVYLIAPPGVLDAADLMMEFVDFARNEKGVRRFVLQSASCIESGGPSMGKVHGHLRELGSRGELEWAVLRPSWFQRGFSFSFSFRFCSDGLVLRWRVSGEEREWKG